MEMKLAKRLIELDTLADKLKIELKAAELEITAIKEVLQKQFVEDGVSSLAVDKKLIYLSSQIWAGTAENATNLQVVDALKAIGREDAISYNTQSVSGYVREIAKGYEDWVNKNNQIIATPEQILAVLPGGLSTLLKITRKTDVRVRAK